MKIRALLARMSIAITLLVAFGGISGEASQRAEATSLYEASAASVGLFVHQYNVCGAACVDDDNPNTNPAEAVNYAAWNFNALSGVSLALNEICREQLDTITSHIGGQWSWVFVVSLDEAENCPGDDQRFGNAVLHRGDTVEYDGYRLSNPGVDCDVNECRTMVCAHVEPIAAAAEFSNCSSHFSRTTGTAQTQANEYIFIATAFADGRPQWIAGDFNLTPGQLPEACSAPWQSLAQHNTLPAPNPDRQVDYIWARTPSWSTRALDCSSQVGFSDHCYIYGWVSIPSS